MQVASELAVGNVRSHLVDQPARLREKPAAGFHVHHERLDDLAKLGVALGAGNLLRLGGHVGKPNQSFERVVLADGHNLDLEDVAPAGELVRKLVDDQFRRQEAIHELPEVQVEMHRPRFAGTEQRNPDGDVGVGLPWRTPVGVGEDGQGAGAGRGDNATLAIDHQQQVCKSSQNAIHPFRWGGLGRLGRWWSEGGQWDASVGVHP